MQPCVFRVIRYSPDSAGHQKPPLRSGYGDMGRRTDPSPRRTLGYGSWFWCRLFSGGTGGKWIPGIKEKLVQYSGKELNK